MIADPDQFWILIFLWIELRTRPANAENKHIVNAFIFYLFILLL